MLDQAIKQTNRIDGDDTIQYDHPKHKQKNKHTNGINDGDTGLDIVQYGRIKLRPHPPPDQVASHI